NPGERAVMNDAKRELIAASRSEADEILSDLVERWPVDVISTSTLGELITGQLGGRLMRGHDHALERAGIRSREGKIRVGSVMTRVRILRNYERWKNADAQQI